MPRAPLAAFSLPKRRRPMRRQQQPDSIRLFYYSAVRALMAKAHALVTSELIPLVHELVPDATTDSHLTLVRDAADDAGERIRAKVDELAKTFARNVTPLKAGIVAKQVADRTATFQKAQLQTQLRDAMGVDPFIRDTKLQAMAEAFTKENVALIRTVPTDYFSSLKKDVVEGVEGGSRAGTIAKTIEQRYQVSESNAARIANTSVGQFFGALNEARSQELGITRYEWACVADNRTRDNHQALNGQVFEWDNPPMGGGTDDAEAGNPGFGINCRCQALPDVSQLLGS